MSRYLSPTTQSTCARHLRSVVTLVRLMRGRRRAVRRALRRSPPSRFPVSSSKRRRPRRKPRRKPRPPRARRRRRDRLRRRHRLPLHRRSLASPRGSLTVPTTAQVQADLARVPGSVVVVPDTAYKTSTPAATIKDVLDYVPGVFVQPKWGEDTRLSIRGSGLSRNFHLRSIQLYHGRHPDQHGRRLRRFPGDRSDRLSLRRGLQGRQRAAVRRQLARRRDQFRDADRPRRQPHSAPAPTSAASASTACRRARAAPTGRSTSSSPARGRSRTASATTAGAKSTRASANLGYRLSPNVETRFYFNANDIMQRIPGGVTQGAWP